VDILPNRILRTSLRSLLNPRISLDRSIRSEVRSAYCRLGGVSPVRLKRNTFSQVQLGGQRRVHRHLLSVCWLLHRRAIVDEKTGHTTFRDFRRDKKRMWKLFEDFVTGFYEREQRVYRVNPGGRRRIDWADAHAADGANRALIPVMEADVLPESPEPALWHLGLDLIGTAEQNSRGPQQHSVLEQLHALKHFGGLPSPRILQPAPSDRFPDSLLDFGRVEVVHRPTGRRLVLPASLGVHSFEENPVVLFGRHLQCGVAYPSVGHPLVDVRFRRSGRRNHNDHLIAARDRDPLNRREDPRLDALDLSAHLLDRVVADLLSNHGSIGSDTEQDVSAALIEHRAQRLGRIAALSCRSLNSSVSDSPAAANPEIRSAVMRASMSYTQIPAYEARFRSGRASGSLSRAFGHRNGEIPGITQNHAESRRITQNHAESRRIV